MTTMAVLRNIHTWNMNLFCCLILGSSRWNESQINAKTSKPAQLKEGRVSRCGPRHMYLFMDVWTDIDDYVYR